MLFTTWILSVLIVNTAVAAMMLSVMESLLLEMSDTIRGVKKGFVWF